MFLNSLALATALCLSSIAAYFSIMGMTAIFSASFWPIVIMMVALETAKIVTAAWLKFHWSEIGIWLRAYLVAATVVIMAITSLGVYGFLAKAHLDQKVQVETGVGEKIELIESKIAGEQSLVDDYDKQLEILDKPISKLIETSKRSRDARRAIWYANKATKERKKVLDKRQVHIEKMAELTTERIQLRSERAKQEAKVGPIKYVANLVYGNASPDQLERAVRWLIIILVATFDPLAIALLLGANIQFRSKSNMKYILAEFQRTQQPKGRKPKTPKDSVNIKKNEIMKLK